MILELLDEAVASGARLSRACATLGLSTRAVQRWRARPGVEDGRHGPNTVPGNKLDEAERARILKVANSPEYRDLSPKQIVPRLADRGEYIASESSFYRVLRENDLLTHREPIRRSAQRRDSAMGFDSPSVSSSYPSPSTC